MQAKVMKELPNIGQNWLNFTRTLPGVTGNAEAVSVNGGQRFWGNWLSDGGLVVIPRSQNLDSPVIFESMAEVKITTSTFDGQYGSGTVVLNQITKSGTNQFHGTLYLLQLRHDYQ
ncbi:MAG TPA: hypothetical protein VER03_08835 [Bryobacteraceae bacterium]|nr:hypothetical protein [Bryobacteraceae bacterium]